MPILAAHYADALGPLGPATRPTHPLVGDTQEAMYETEGRVASQVWSTLAETQKKTPFDYDLPESGHGILEKYLGKKFGPLAQRVSHGDASATLIGWPESRGGHMNLLVGLTPVQLANLDPAGHGKFVTEETSVLGALGPRLNAWGVLGKEMFAAYYASEDMVSLYGSFEAVDDPAANDQRNPNRENLEEAAVEALHYVKECDDHFDDPRIPNADGTFIQCRHNMQLYQFDTVEWPCPGSSKVFRARKGNVLQTRGLKYGVVRHALSALERDAYKLTPYHLHRYVCWYGTWSLATESMDRSYYADARTYKKPAFVVSFPRMLSASGAWLGLNPDEMQTKWRDEKTSERRYYRKMGRGAKNCASQSFNVLKAGIDGSRNGARVYADWMKWDRMNIPGTTDAHEAAAELLKLMWMRADQYRILRARALARRGLQEGQGGHEGRSVRNVFDTRLPGSSCVPNTPTFVWGRLRVSSTTYTSAMMPRRYTSAISRDISATIRRWTPSSSGVSARSCSTTRIDGAIAATAAGC